MGLRFSVMADETSNFVKLFEQTTSFWNYCRLQQLYECAEDLIRLGQSLEQQICTLDRPDRKSFGRTNHFELGGEVLLDAKGNVIFVHWCRSRDDRPTWEDLTKVIPSDCSTSMQVKLKICTIL
uniref:Uncharacterized protein n=1 Tax=Romanomermis culicivorax TaxID=13658 RepID=A0A915LB40_ROMCU